MEAGRDAAMRLVRMAYDFPPSTRTATSAASPPDLQRPTALVSLLPVPRPAAARRIRPPLPAGQGQPGARRRRASLHSLGQDARGRRQLLDTYGLQYGVRQMAYWQNWYDHGNAGAHGEVAALQMDPKITTAVGGLHLQPDVGVSAAAGGRSGLHVPEHAARRHDGHRLVLLHLPRRRRRRQWLEDYIKNGGDPKYDLTDPKRYPRVVAGTYFGLEGSIAGMQHPAVGDVGGSIARYGEWTPGKSAGEYANTGWRWTKDPRFAYCVVNYGQRKTRDGRGVGGDRRRREGVRNPFMSNRSRILATGAASSKAARSRTTSASATPRACASGCGTGHDHADTLDLGLWSLGLQMSITPARAAATASPAPLVYQPQRRDRRRAELADVHLGSQLADMDNVQYLRPRRVPEGIRPPGGADRARQGQAAKESAEQRRTSARHDVRQRYRSAARVRLRRVPRRRRQASTCTTSTASRRRVHDERQARRA